MDLRLDEFDAHGNLHKPRRWTTSYYADDPVDASRETAEQLDRAMFLIQDPADALGKKLAKRVSISEIILKRFERSRPSVWGWRVQVRAYAKVSYDGRRRHWLQCEDLRAVGWNVDTWPQEVFPLDTKELEWRLTELFRPLFARLPK
ncbi:hypothetical protein ACU686_12750 [Yinghuangia aomiensis]